MPGCTRTNSPKRRCDAWCGCRDGREIVSSCTVAWIVSTPSPRDGLRPPIATPILGPCTIDRIHDFAGGSSYSSSEWTRRTTNSSPDVFVGLPHTDRSPFPRGCWNCPTPRPGVTHSREFPRDDAANSRWFDRAVSGSDPIGTEMLQIRDGIVHSSEPQVAGEGVQDVFANGSPGEGHTEVLPALLLVMIPIEEDAREGTPSKTCRMAPCRARAPSAKHGIRCVANTS